MVTNLGIPRLSEDHLGRQAEAFLKQHNVWGSVPVDIERIVEFNLGMDIIPVPNLRQTYDIETFTSWDLSSIVVDDYVQAHWENHYRFSLAHEVGHLVLHREVLTRHQYASIEEFKVVLSQMDPLDYDRLELQANDFAGLVLVSPPMLRPRFSAVKQALVKRGAQQGISLTDYWDAVVYYIADQLGKEFKVSREVIEIRMRNDHLGKNSV